MKVSTEQLSKTKSELEELHTLLSDSVSLLQDKRFINLMTYFKIELVNLQDALLTLSYLDKSIELGQATEDLILKMKAFRSFSELIGLGTSTSLLESRYLTKKEEYALLKNNALN